MNSLIEVDMTTIREAALHFKRCKIAGQAIIDRLKKTKDYGKDLDLLREREKCLGVPWHD